MTLVAHTPSRYASERAYAIGVLFDEFIGIHCEVMPEDRSDTVITSTGDGESRCLRLADTFFNAAQDDWLGSASLPSIPLTTWVIPEHFGGRALCSTSVPVVYGERLASGGFMSSDGTSIELGIDILGSTFFLLTRYEEQVSTARDARGRFPASASVAVRGEFLDRPLVNEYLEVLWTCLQRLWPGLVRRRRSSRVFVTHDVDHPCCSYGVPWLYAVKHAGGDILHRGDLSLAAHRLTRLMRPRSGAAERDPCFTFPFLMLASEQRGVTSTFNFICTQRPSSIDAYYSLDDAFIRALMVQIHERGHEVGYHASYRSGDDPKRIAGEFQMLRNTAASLHIAQSNWGGRHHYLRWRADSWSQWEAAGLQYDSSLGYPELAGFRCGTCYEYPVYSLLTHQALGVRERPLIAMDVSLLSKRYAGLRNEQALATISELAATCRRFSGDFVLLWHNDMVVGPAARAFYTRILEAVVPN